MSKNARSVGRPGFATAESHAYELFLREGRHIKLSRDASAPLWEQLYLHLENLILSGKLAIDSRIPSEPILCQLFEVSKPVVRHAISALASKGLVVKVPRKGMFVGHRPRESGFVTSNVSLFDDMIARGATIDTRTFQFIKCAADPEEQDGLGLAEGDEVIRITRVFHVDGRAITHTVMSFPSAKLPGFEHATFKGQSILGTIRNVYGLNIVRADRWLNAAVPPQLILTRMGIVDNRPMIFIESIGYQEDGSRLEYYRAYYDSSAARIHLSVSD